MAMYRSLLTVIILLNLIFFFSCSEEKPKKEITTLEFTIDTNLVTNYISFDDFKIAIRIPNDWMKLNSAMLEEIINKLGEGNNSNLEYNYQPEFVFKNDSTQSILAIGSVTSISNIEEYLTSINSQFAGWDVRRGDFTNNNINFSQFLMQKENMILFKLVFKNYNKIIQIDYSLSKQFYADEIKKVESSIGSIKPLIY